jgi:MoxR-like ATPase
MRPEIATLLEALAREAFVADRATATALHLARTLRKPLLVEGHPGTGKTELARVLARVLGTDLVRLQCYEGLDAASALYEWNYPRQLLHLKAQEGSGLDAAEREESLFTERFLLKRPLLDAITRPERAPVLLIDEVDRSDEEFEAFLLEVLADFQVSIPELGTVRATHPPVVVLTSNRTRELSEALRRRCLYLWVPYPDFARELAIVHARVPEAAAALAAEVTRVVQGIRHLALAKVPGVAETLDWARALVTLGAGAVDDELLRETAGVLLKDEGDLRVLASALDHGGVAALATTGASAGPAS